MAHLLPPLLALACAAAPQDPGSALEAFVGDPHLAGARIGVLVRDLADGREICAHDPDHGFMTASNMKLISSATALATLGPDHRFRTTLVATGPLGDGVLEGDLVLVGSGDPTFGAGDDPREVLFALVDRVIADTGLRAIHGDVLGDDDCHPDETMGEGWSWNYQGASYAAQVSGLCFAENCATVVATAAADAQPPVIDLVPQTAYLTVENGAICSAELGRSALWAERQRASNRIRVGGRLPTDARAWRRTVSVENPTAYAATVLAEVLRERGVEITGTALDRDERPPRPERYGDETVLATHESAPLREILVTLNKVSQNLYAEQVLRAASRHARGDGGMTTAAAHAKATLRELGVDTTGMRIADGSGLTRLDLVRPRQLADLLTAIWGGELRETYLPTLPIAGVDGTLRGRFRDGPAAGRVRAKTGTISSVIALSGYVMRKGDAAPLCFSILVNNFTCRSADTKAAVDRFVEALVSAADA